MKNFILKNGDAIINYGAWICSGIITLGCFIIFMNFCNLSHKTGDGSFIFSGLVISAMAWVFGMLCVVQIFYFLYGFIDMRDNLNEIKNILVYNGGNINISNQPNPNVINDYTQSYQSIQKMKSNDTSESNQKKPSNDNQEQNICSESQDINNETSTTSNVNNKDVSNLTNQPNNQINSEVEKNNNKDYQSVQNTELINKLASEQEKPGSDNQEQNICRERQSINKEPLTLKIAFKNLWKGKFKGRCSLLEYRVTFGLGIISFFVFEFIAAFVVSIVTYSLSAIFGFANSGIAYHIIMTLANLAIIIVAAKPTFALIHRRFLDFGLEIPALVMVIFFPLIGLLSLIGLFIPGNKEENEFGLPSPYYFVSNELFISKTLVVFFILIIFWGAFYIRNFISGFSLQNNGIIANNRVLGYDQIFQEKDKDNIQSVQSQSDFEALAQPKSEILTFDKLQLHTPSLIGKSVDVEGHCFFSQGHFFLSRSGNYNDVLNSILLDTDNLSQDTRELLYEVCKDNGNNIVMKILVKEYRPKVLKIYGNIN